MRRLLSRLTTPRQQPASGNALSTTGVMMPAGFDVRSYNAVHERVEPKRAAFPDACEQFGGAWNAVGYRCKAADEHSRAFTNSIRRYGDSPPPLQRYEQERDIFNFFVTGLATIESFFYAMYAVGAILDAAAFPMGSGDLRGINPRSVVPRFVGRFPGDAFTVAVQAPLAAAEYGEWRDVRNILAHRTALGRTFSMHLSVGQPPVKGPTGWTGSPGFDFTDQATSSRLAWLSIALNSLLAAASDFVTRTLK